MKECEKRYLESKIVSKWIDTNIRTAGGPRGCNFTLYAVPFPSYVGTFEAQKDLLQDFGLVAKIYSSSASVCRRDYQVDEQHTVFLHAK